MGVQKKKKRKLNYRGIIALIGIILIIVAIVIFATKKNKKEEPKQENAEIIQQDETGIKTNTSEELKKEKTFFGYQISNVTLQEVEGENTFNAKLKNVTQSSIGNESIYIVFKSNSGEELYKMQVYVTEIKPGKTIEINSVITKDIIESYELEIVK